MATARDARTEKLTGYAAVLEFLEQERGLVTCRRTLLRWRHRPDPFPLVHHEGRVRTTRSQVVAWAERNADLLV